MDRDRKPIVHDRHDLDAMRRELNQSHAAFIERFRETDLDVSAFAKFLSLGAKENLSDFAGLMEQLQFIHAENARISSQITHTLELTRALLGLYATCHDAIPFAKTTRDKTDTKLMAELEISDDITLTQEEKAALLAVLQTYAPDLPSLEQTPQDVIDDLRKHLNITPDDPTTAKVIPFKKPDTPAS